MFSYWAYVLIGNNDTGKTTFQKFLVWNLCGQWYDRLTTNLLSDITHPRMPRGVESLSTMNRSFQEKIADYRDVANFFRNHFKEGHISILSSHTGSSSIDHLREMVLELRRRAYNVAAVFFSNGYDRDAKEIALLDWDERLWVDNPPVQTEDEIEEQIEEQIEQLANEFANLLIARAAVL